MSKPSKILRRKYGALDIGSNSVRLVIYDVYGSSFVSIYNEKIHAGLGRDLRRTGRLSVSGKAETKAALARFAIICAAQGVEKVLIGATAAMREAEDAPEFIAEVKQATGFDLSPVSGADEARLSAMGLLAAIPQAKGLAADLGGASLELIRVKDSELGQDSELEMGETFPLGPFHMLGAAELSGSQFNPEALRAQITQILDVKSAPNTIETGDTLYLIGGAWRNLAAIHHAKIEYPLRTMQGYTLSPKAALELAEWAAGEGRKTVTDWPGLSPRRAETLPYSAVLLSVLIARLSPARIVISTTGLREGLLYDALPASIRARDALLDGCRDLAFGTIQGGGSFAEPLYNFLEPASAQFPTSFSPSSEIRLRRAACILAGIGKGLDPSYRAQLVFEDVLYAPLSGLTHKERAYLALIVFRSYTGKAKTPNAAAVQLLLSKREQAAASIYGLAIRMAVVASGRSAKLLEHFSLTIENETASMTLDPAYSALHGGRLSHRLAKLGEALKAYPEKT